MYQTAIEKIKKSIFPIFYKSVQEKTLQIGVSGTGFFISSQGHFLTALHVITQTPANSIFQYSGNIPHHITNPPHVITEIYRDPIRDIFLGKINLTETIPVTFVFNKPKVGKSVCLCGYPLAQLVKNSNGSINVDAVRQYWQPTFIIDVITVSDNEKKYPGFLTQHTSLNGMSGAPVFDTNGIVYGVDTAFLQRQIPQKNKPAIQVLNGIAIENTSIADVYAKVT
jgi:S1-C subfamily serine protease